MNPIEVAKAIDTYGISVVTAICLGLIVWLVRYLINEQSKNNKTILSMFKIELKALHKDGLTNARLNRKSIRIVKNLSEYMNKHFNGSTEQVALREGKK